MTTSAAPLCGCTMAGDRYEIMVVLAGLEERVAHVSLDVFGDRAIAEASLVLTPDEARSLAADLQRWAGHAEREGRR